MSHSDSDRVDNTFEERILFLEDFSRFHVMKIASKFRAISFSTLTNEMLYIANLRDHWKLYRIILCGPVLQFLLANSKSASIQWTLFSDTRTDSISSISIPKLFGKVTDLSESFITLVYIDLHMQPASWVTRFLQRTFSEGMYWTPGHTGALLIPLFHCTQEGDYDLIPPDVLYFSVILGQEVSLQVQHSSNISSPFTDSSSIKSATAACDLHDSSVRTHIQTNFYDH